MKEYVQLDFHRQTFCNGNLELNHLNLMKLKAWWRLMAVMAVSCLVSLAARAQDMSIYGKLDVSLFCQVPTVTYPGAFPSAGTTNLYINTHSLLQLIASDQGITLPDHAALWLANNTFFILNQTNGIVATVDTNLFQISYGASATKSKLIQKAKLYVETADEKTTVNLSYQGNQISFNASFTGDYLFYNQANWANQNAFVSYAFSGNGSGTGTWNGHALTLKGTLTDKFNYPYNVGTYTGQLPAGGPVAGAFP